MNESSIVIFDTRGIKHFVDDRRYLPEIRDASKSLTLAVEESVKSIDKFVEKRIYVGGGNALLILKEPLTDEIKEIAKKKFKDKLGIKGNEPPQLLILSDEKANKLYKNGDFRGARSQLMISVGKYKRSFHNNISDQFIPNIDKNINYCDSCKIRAVDKQKNERSVKKNICESCNYLYENGMSVLSKGIANINSGKPFDKYYDFTFSNVNIPINEFKKHQMEFIAGLDLNALNNNNNNDTRARIAIVQLDGNLFGNYFGSITDEDKLKEASEKIDKVSNEIFKSLVSEIKKTNEMDAIRVLLGKVYIGGDDFKLIVPGKLAIPIANYLMTEFNKRINLDKNLVLSAGIAIGRPKMPLQSLLNISSYLLKSAKEGQNIKLGSLDFQILMNTSSINSLKTFRKTYQSEYRFYYGSHNLDSKFWRKIHGIFPSLTTFREIPKDEIKKKKSAYINPWKHLLNYYIHNINTKGMNNIKLYAIRQQMRNKKEGIGVHDGYESGRELMFMEDGEKYSNYLERAIELISLRYEL